MNREIGLNHLACIMDGNRRWAIQRGLVPWLGHRKGFDAAQLAITFCLEKKIPYLSLYAFSIENFQHRSEVEQQFLFETLAPEIASTFEKELVEKKIRVRFIGDRSLWSKTTRTLCEKIEHETALCDALQVNFLLGYGGQQEIIDAVKRVAVKVKKGDLNEADITTNVFEHFLWTAAIPSPDLVIRTGGQSRLSNFFLFKIAYSELYFLDCLWPDIAESDLEKAVLFFTECQRNFGK